MPSFAGAPSGAPRFFPAACTCCGTLFANRLPQRRHIHKDKVRVVDRPHHELRLVRYARLVPRLIVDPIDSQGAASQVEKCTTVRGHPVFDHLVGFKGANENGRVRVHRNRPCLVLTGVDCDQLVGRRNRSKCSLSMSRHQPRHPRKNPHLIQMGLSRALVRLHVTDTGPGRQDLHVTWPQAYRNQNPLPLSYLPCHDDGDDLNLVMEVERKTTRGVDKIIVEKPETAPADVSGLEVVAVREQQEVLGTLQHSEVSLLRRYAANHPPSLWAWSSNRISPALIMSRNVCPMVGSNCVPRCPAISSRAAAAGREWRYGR